MPLSSCAAQHPTHRSFPCLSKSLGSDSGSDSQWGDFFGFCGRCVWLEVLENSNRSIFHMLMFCSRVLQEPETIVPEKIRSISGANKRRHSSESEPEEEPSCSEEEEEQKQEIEKSSASDLSSAEKPEEGVKKAVANQQPAAPSVPVCQAASNKPPCKPAVFVPVDRSPEIQVRLSEQWTAYHRGWKWWCPPSD